MKNLDCQGIVAAVQSVLPHRDESVALHEPLFCGNDWTYIKECLDTGWVSYLGRFVDEFERRLAEFTGLQKAVAVVSGTAALHIALKTAGVERDDEVLMPTLTFVATANAVTYCGAIPHFADSSEQTLGLDPHKLMEYLLDIADIGGDAIYNRKTRRRIRAVIPVHTLGHPVDLDPLSEVCRRFNLTLIEDAAESMGSYYKGRHTGNWGKLSILSFNGNKTITTGGGGAILTNDAALGDEVKHLTTTAKVPHPWAYYHDRIGYNYRLPNINAALGCAQMEQLDTFLKRKRNLAHRYEKAFSGMEGLRFFKEPPFARSNYWLNALLLEPEWESQRNTLLERLIRNRIMARPAWTLMHRLPMFLDCPRMDLSTAESLERRIINIPSGPALGGPDA